MLSSKLIGEKIAEARKKSGLSQAQLGDQLFISPQAVGKWERGESLPDVITLNQLATLFNVEIGYFVGSERLHEVQKQPDQTESNEVQSTATNWNMSKGNWVDADFSGLMNQKDQFSGSNIKNCKFVGAQLAELLLKGNNIEKSDFSMSDLRGSHFQHSNLDHNQFESSQLMGSKFSTSNVHRCSFEGANLSQAVFEKTRLNQLNFTNTLFEGTRFYASQLDELTFTSNISNCSFEMCSFYRVTFEGVEFRSSFFKNNKNLKRVKFVQCKADKLTYAFLKTGNADMTGITLLEE